jgi:glycosyltransferase involved in cell wall biosynthesis
MKIYSYLDSGRPVLATRLATHTQVLDDSISLLAAPTTRDFANAMVRLVDNPGLRQQLAAEAKLRVGQEFTRAAFERKLRRFYQDMERRLLPGG